MSLGGPKVLDYIPTSNVCGEYFAAYNIINYDPSLTYTLIGDGVNALPTHPKGTFRLKGGSGSTGGTFTLTASNDCGTVRRSGQVSFVECSGTSVLQPDQEAKSAHSQVNGQLDEESLAFEKLKVKLMILNNPVLQGNLRFIITNTTISKKADISVLDYTGRIVIKSTAYSSINKNIDVSRLTAGIYILVVKLDGLQLRQSFIK